MSQVIGLDIGGANIKVSDGTRSESFAFEMWKSHEKLTATVQRILASYPNAGTIAATLTGELADCFETRTAGVRFILDSLAKAAEGRAVRIWYSGGEFLSLTEAHEFPLLVAAANWHSLATWVGRAHPNGTAILIDIGSTTTDVIPIQQGLPMPTGLTDTERLISGELIYTGVRRTPICSIVNEVKINDQDCGVAAELFATTLDLSLILRDVVDDPANLDTANGTPATRHHAQTRLARMVCTDQDELSEEELISIAEQIRQKQIELIHRGIAKVLGRLEERPTVHIVSGEGEFLINDICGCSEVLQNSERLSLKTLLGWSHSSAACAYALVQLADNVLFPD